MKITNAFKCNQCGNFRNLLPEACPHCYSVEPPTALVEYWSQDIHQNLPEVEVAMDQMDRIIRAAFASGLKGLIVIHGYGSSGRGGAIGRAAKDQLQSNRWSQYVKEYVPGEEVQLNSDVAKHWGKYRAHLADYLKKNRLFGNHGVTVLLLNKSRSTLTER
jgi:hypothetical protein